MWSYRTPTGPTGPVDRHTIADLVEEGVIGPETLVLKNGDSEWKSAGDTEISVLFDNDPQNDIHFIAPQADSAPKILYDDFEVQLRAEISSFYRRARYEMAEYEIFKVYNEDQFCDAFLEWSGKALANHRAEQIKNNKPVRFKIEDSVKILIEGFTSCVSPKDIGFNPSISLVDGEQIAQRRISWFAYITLIIFMIAGGLIAQSNDKPVFGGMLVAGVAWLAVAGLIIDSNKKKGDKKD